MILGEVGVQCGLRMGDLPSSTWRVPDLVLSILALSVRLGNRVGHSAVIKPAMGLAKPLHSIGGVATQAEYGLAVEVDTPTPGRTAAVHPAGS